jgi:hypothetical protein
MLQFLPLHSLKRFLCHRVLLGFVVHDGNPGFRPSGAQDTGVGVFGNMHLLFKSSVAKRAWFCGGMRFIGWYGDGLIAVLRMFRTGSICL